MKRLTLIILALAAICSFTGTDAAAQAKFTTRKEKLSDLMYKTTKVVLTGNELLDESFKEEVIRRWRITPYEFCTFDEFNTLKGSADYYFLLIVQAQFRKETEPGLSMMTLIKGGSAPKPDSPLNDFYEVISLPLCSSTMSSGREVVFMSAFIDLVQEMTDRENKVASIEVSALTTPDNELARRAARNPAALSSRDYETWYCTAYVSAICYQIQEVITGSVASAVRKVAESEGTILDKTKLLMILITALSLIGSALGISNLVTASVMERSQEIGLFKAIGARDHSITGVVMTEILITALVGFGVGYFLGLGFAQLIGQSVFGSAIDPNPKVAPIVAGLIALVTIAGSLPAIRQVLRLRPAEVLHGGH